MITIALVIVSFIIVVYLLDICGIQGTVKDHFKDASTVSKYSLDGEYIVEDAGVSFFLSTQDNGLTRITYPEEPPMFLDTKTLEEGKPVVINEHKGAGDFIQKMYIKYVANECSLINGIDDPDKKGKILWGGFWLWTAKKAECPK